MSLWLATTQMVPHHCNRVLEEKRRSRINYCIDWRTWVLKGTRSTHRAMSMYISRGCPLRPLLLWSWLLQINFLLILIVFFIFLIFIVVAEVLQGCALEKLWCLDCGETRLTSMRSFLDSKLKKLPGSEISSSSSEIRRCLGRCGHHPSSRF